MKYKINLYGKGNELTIGKISDEIWKYIKENFDCDATEYLEAWDEGKVPEQFQIASDTLSLYECDDLHHYDGCWTSWFRLEILDENDDEVCVITNFDDVESKIDYKSIDDVEHYAVFTSVAKGLYLTGEFELDEPFDIDKLCLNVSQVSWDNDEIYDRIIDSISYNDEVLDLEFDSSDGKGDTLTFYETKHE